MIQHRNGKPPATQTVRNRLPASVPAVPQEWGGAPGPRIENWIVKHPAVCVAVAVTLGVTLGWLIKRR